MADLQTTFNDDEILDVAFVGDFHDAHGKIAKIDGPIEWTSSNANVAEVVPDPADLTGKTCAIVSGVKGPADVTASADVDLGAGVKRITFVIAVQINEAPAGEALGFPSATLGTPRKKP